MQKNYTSSNNNKKNNNGSDLAAKYKEEMMQQYKKSRQPQNNTATPPPPQNNTPAPAPSPVPTPAPSPQNNIPATKPQQKNNNKPPKNDLPKPIPNPEPPVEFVQEMIIEVPKTPEVKPGVVVVPELIFPSTPVETKPNLTEEQLNNPPMPKIPVSVREEVEKTNGDHNLSQMQKPPVKMPAPERKSIEVDVEIIPIIPDIKGEITELKFPTAEEILKAEMEIDIESKPDLTCSKSSTKIMAEDEQKQDDKLIVSQEKTPSKTQPTPVNEEKTDIIRPNNLLQPKDRDCACGYLAVEVLTAKGNSPIEDATVVVTEIQNNCCKKELIAMLFTDIYGETKSLELPSNNVEKSVYCISVFADGYVPVRNIDVPIYPDIKSIQPISLISIDEYKN